MWKLIKWTVKKDNQNSLAYDRKITDFLINFGIWRLTTQDVKCSQAQEIKDELQPLHVKSSKVFSTSHQTLSQFDQSFKNLKRSLLTQCEKDARQDKRGDDCLFVDSSSFWEIISLRRMSAEQYIWTIHIFWNIVIYLATAMEYGLFWLFVVFLTEGNFSHSIC